MSSPNESDLTDIRAIELAELIHKVREKQPLTSEEQQRLDAWLNGDRAHAALFERLQDRDHIASELKALLQYDEDMAVSAVFKAIGKQAPPVERKWGRIIRWSAIAASLLLMAGTCWWLFTGPQRTRQDAQQSMASVAMLPGNNKALLILSDGKNVLLDGAGTRSIGIQGAAIIEQQKDHLIYRNRSNGEMVYNTITTPPGGQYRLQLADGTEVWLNTASSVTYPTSFTGKIRDVTITGEAYFSVAKDKTRPFLVTANSMKIEVVGTEFNVMAYSDEDAIRTTLITGAVRAGNAHGGEVLTLQPGEQAALGRYSGPLHIEKPDVDEVTAWRFGSLRFHETSMAAIMRQITRWYDVKLEYRGSLDGISFTGQLSKKEQLQDLLDILSDTRNVHFEMKDDKTIVVIPGPR